MPPKAELERLLPCYFILNKPRNIVSGDYYWLAQKGQKVLVAVADCTGHGIPGAFMSIIGITCLKEILNKTLAIRANEFLNQLRAQVIEALHQTGRREEARDGMEIALCVIDFGKKKLQFSGAFRPLYLLRDKSLIELRGDSMPIGQYDKEEESFKNEELSFEENDVIYLFTDGYVDQLGGPDRKTFKSRRFKQLLIDIHQKSLLEQKQILEQEYEAWRNNVEQIDDILVMGIRFI